MYPLSNLDNVSKRLAHLLLLHSLSQTLLIYMRGHPLFRVKTSITWIFEWSNDLSNAYFRL